MSHVEDWPVTNQLPIAGSSDRRSRRVDFGGCIRSICSLSSLIVVLVAAISFAAGFRYSSAGGNVVSLFNALVASSDPPTVEVLGRRSVAAVVAPWVANGNVANASDTSPGNSTTLSAEMRNLTAADREGDRTIVDPPVKASSRGLSFVYSVLTTGAYHSTRLKAVLSTWGKYVSIPFVASDVADPSVPSVFVASSDANDLSGKTLRAFEKFCEYDADYYILVDDDSFVIADNLEGMIASRFPGRGDAVDVYGGYLLVHTKPFLIGGGGGIVLSNLTMRKFCSNVQASRDNPTAYSPCSSEKNRFRPGDAQLALCMSAIGVAATHIEGFSPFPIIEISRRGDPQREWCRITWWLPKFVQCNPPPPELGSMHYVADGDYEELRYLAYQLFTQKDMKEMIAS